MTDYLKGEMVLIKSKSNGQAGFFNGMTGKVLEVEVFGFGTTFTIKVNFQLEDDSGAYEDVCSFYHDEVVKIK